MLFKRFRRFIRAKARRERARLDRERRHEADMAHLKMQEELRLFEEMQKPETASVESALRWAGMVGFIDRAFIIRVRDNLTMQRWTTPHD